MGVWGVGVWGVRAAQVPSAPWDPEQHLGRALGDHSQDHPSLVCVVTGRALHPGSELWSCWPETHQNHCGLRHTPGRALCHHYSLFSFLPAFSQHFPIFVYIIFFSFSPFTSFSSFQGMPGPLLNFYMTKE